MEIFVFPDIMFSLVLANIMSPLIWKWLDDPWFQDIDRHNPYKKIQRLRQYIMDNYNFNLDLDTWGLTTKEEQLDRFRSFIDIDILSRSNALFGYEGDKYYFDIDIRHHFGLDKYTTETIPYWKTETVEAMDAFRHKEGYTTGAGECVSLACLWAAALFVICKIPLNEIFLLGTPLHSQNFVMVRDGILTNNRRIVTRNMWVNGTQLSMKARRALENEQVTVVAHLSGYVHTMYKDATIDTGQYRRFTENLLDFLNFKLTSEILTNFLRAMSGLQKCFQFEHILNGHKCYIALERLFAYEHTSRYALIGPSRKNLLDEIDSEEFHCGLLPERIIFNELEAFVDRENISPDNIADLEKLRKYINGNCLNVHTVIESIHNFCVTKPRLPDLEIKTCRSYPRSLQIEPDMNRLQIIEYLESMRRDNPLADYAFYAYRDLNRTEAEPFLKAALERNPVSLLGFKDREPEAVVQMLNGYSDQSIYSESGRLAQPDEVFNYQRGDGVEKALVLANVLRARGMQKITLRLQTGFVVVECGDFRAQFSTTKELGERSWEFAGGGYAENKAGALSESARR